MTEQEFVQEMHRQMEIETAWPLFWFGYLVLSRKRPPRLRWDMK